MHLSQTAPRRKLLVVINSDVSWFLIERNLNQILSPLSLSCREQGRLAV